MSQKFEQQVINRSNKNSIFKKGRVHCSVPSKPCMSDLATEFLKVAALITFFLIEFDVT